jgi:hypothetical protein
MQGFKIRNCYVLDHTHNPAFHTGLGKGLPVIFTFILMTQEVIMDKNKSQTCSFCNQSITHTHHLHIGPGTNTRICNACISFAEELLRHDTPTNQEGGECSFCGRTHLQVEKLLYGPGVNICSECIAFAIQSRDDDDANTTPSSSLWNKVVACIRSLFFVAHGKNQVSFKS